MPLNYALKNGEYGYIYITIIETDSLYPHVLMFMPLCDHCIHTVSHCIPKSMTLVPLGNHIRLGVSGQDQ